MNNRSGTLLPNGIYVASLTGDSDNNGSSLYHCDCHCGIRFVTSYNEAARRKSCGCMSRNHPNFSDKTGLRKAYCWFKGNHKKDKDRMLSEEEFRRLVMLDCRYCDAPPGNTSAGALAYQGLDRVVNEGGCLPDNLVPACGWCNHMKKDKSLDAFRQQILRMAVVMFDRYELEEARRQYEYECEQAATA